MIALVRMLEAKNLTCVREDRQLFTGLGLKLEAGQIIQIEGRNGLGKSSLMRLLTGLNQPVEGEVLWQGESITEQRENYHQKLLYIGHQTGVKPLLTAYENLSLLEGLHHRQKDEDLWQALLQAGLAGFEDFPARQLSAGQQRRVALARLWLSHAPLWILDEPFTAIDVRGVSVLEQRFAQHLDQGGMIMMTSHQSLQHLNDRIDRLDLSQFASEATDVW